MREVFVNQDHARVGFYKSVLEEAQIPCFIRNEISNNITEMPTPIFFPALCVTRDEDYEEAMRLLSAIYYAEPVVGTDWQCSRCSEEVPASFDSCWKCGAERADRAAGSPT